MFGSSVRARTTTVAVLLFALATVAAVIGLTVVLRASLLDEVDRSIDSRAADIAAQVTTDSEFISLGTGIDTDTLAVVFSLDGAIFDSSDNTVDVNELAATFDVSDTPFDASLPSLLETTGSDNMRAVVLVVPLDLDASPETDEIGDEDFVVYVATSLDGVDRTVARVRTASAIAGPALVLVVGLLTWVSAGRALAPVEAIRSEVSEITATDLHRRVTEPTSGDEIAGLAATMNEMLARLSRAQESQQRFVADASHELRTPLSAMAARLDVAMRHANSDEWPTTARALRDDTERMSRLVDDLLLLANADADADQKDAPVSSALVDIDDVVLAAIDSTPARTDIEVLVPAATGVVGRGSAADLQRVVSNLLANAGRHASSTVAVAVAASECTVRVSVSDDGPGVRQADRERIFERFVRLDGARDRDAGGSGLGLAISREIVKRHGGELSVDSSDLGGAEFTMQLPEHRAP